MLYCGALGALQNGDDLFGMGKWHTAGPSGECAGSGSGDGGGYLTFQLSTRSTNLPTVTGTRTTISYRGYIDPDGEGEHTIDDDEWHHIAVTLYGKNGSLNTTLSCSFFVDGHQLNTCQDDTNTIQQFYDQAVADFGSNGFMHYGGAGSEPFDFSDSATNPLAVIPDTQYRGDEFLTIGGNGYATGNQSNNFSGSMNNITFWTRNLSAAEVNTLYNSGSPCNITCSAPYAADTSALHVWLPMGNAQNPLSGDQADVISATNPTAFTSASHAIWDASGKQNHYWVISDADETANKVVFSTGSADSHIPPMSDIPGCKKTIVGYEEHATYESSSHYDNAYVSHQIPRSDRQYAWITGAIHDPLNEIRYAGYMPTHGTDAGLFSSSYTNGPVAFFNFASASEVGSVIYGTYASTKIADGQEYREGQPMRWAGYERPAWISGYPRSFLPQPCNHLNINIYEPITASTATLGWSASVPLARSQTSTTPFPSTMDWPEGDTTDQYRNWTMVSNSLNSRAAQHFNMLMWKRNGQYGWGTFAQSRQSDHPVLYNQRKNNKLMIQYNTRGVQQEFDLRPVSLKGRPVTLNFDYDTTQVMQGQELIKTANATFKTSYNNEFIYFNSGTLDNHFDIPEALKSEITPFEQLVSLKNRRGITLNWVHYKECLFPSLKNEFATASSVRYGYENKMWRNDIDDRIALGSQVVLTNSVGMSFRVSQSSWPLDAPRGFLTRWHAPWITTFTKSIANYLDVSSLRNGGAHRTGSGEGNAGTPRVGVYGGYYTDSLPFFKGVSQEISGAAGELQNTYGWLHETSSNMANGNVFLSSSNFDTFILAALNPGSLYARKHTLASPLSINPPNYPNQSCSVQDLGLMGGLMPNVDTSAGSHAQKTASFGAGEAWWDAPETAGYLSASKNANTGLRTMHFISAASKPWYNDYEKFREHDMKFLGRGYSVIPEFRISERLEDYADGAVDDFNDFTIPGTEFTSADENFYIDFSNSDFMKKFLDVRRLSDLEAKEIKLTCKAIVKFNPYKGFYPAQRTLDLASQFSKSYGSTVSYDTDSIPTITTAANSSSLGGTPALFRLIMQPLFAPGILYNSIKSGIACDWPLMNRAQNMGVEALTGSKKYGYADPADGVNYVLVPRESPINPSTNYLGNFLREATGSWFDMRLPFEAIINPARFMMGRTFVDMEPHPLVQITGATASMGGAPSDSLYTRMASNFAAEVGHFFLRGRNYSRLESKGVSLGKISFPEGSVYGARLRMKASHSGSRTYEFESSSHGDNTWFTKDGCGAIYRNHADDNALQKGITTGSFEIPQDPSRNPGFKRDFVMYSRATAFGPPIANMSPFLDIVTNGLFEFTLSGRSGSSVGAGSGYLWRITDLEDNYNWYYEGYASASASGSMDALNGYNWAWTPPYYYGEAWADFIFRPSDGTEYSLEKIISELKTEYWRVDPGPQTGSVAKSNPGLPSYTASVYPAQDGVLYQWGGGKIYGENLFSNYNFSSLISDSPPLSGADGGMPMYRNRSPYSSVNINSNAMQMSSSVNLFGIENVYKKQFDRFGREILTEREVVGKKWVIQPKFETPMMNFSDNNTTHPIVGEGTGSANRTKTVPTCADGTEFSYGGDTAANGMWHQFGTLPERPNQGIYLEMGDIPAPWLKYHYSCVSESSVYNNYDPSSTGPTGQSNLASQMQSLSDLLGFTDDNSRVRLGKVARKRVIKEAVVAIPYIFGIYFSAHLHDSRGSYCGRHKCSNRKTKAVY